MLIWDKYENRYRIVIPVEKIEEKLEEIKNDPEWDMLDIREVLKELLEEEEE